MCCAEPGVRCVNCAAGPGGAGGRDAAAEPGGARHGRGELPAPGGHCPLRGRHTACQPPQVRRGWQQGGRCV